MPFPADKVLVQDKIQKNVLLAPHTTFGVGGPAKYFAEPESVEEVREFSVWARDEGHPVFVLGGGSNILVSDKGFHGLVLKNKSKNVEVKKNKIFADSGVLLSKVISLAIQNNLTGVEWAIGIPGTVGGAVYGNAGACGYSISNNIKNVKVFDLKELRIKNYELRDCDFYYRDSIFKRDKNLVVLNAVFNLKKGEGKDIREKIKYFAKERADTANIKEKCAGCFFKNIDWKRKDINKKELLLKFPELKKFSDKPKISAGFLIDFLDLKSRKIGGAFISQKHANFILNSGQASADEIMMLVALIKNKIYSHYGFGLEEEVQLVGFD